MSDKGVDLYWLLLDNQSTVDVFANRRLFKNIRESSRTLKIHSNGSHSVVSQVGYLKNYGDVWFDPNRIANILSLRNVKNKYPVTYNSTTDNTFIVHTPEKEVHFKQSKQGLYYHDT